WTPALHACGPLSRSAVPLPPRPPPFPYTPLFRSRAGAEDELLGLPHVDERRRAALFADLREPQRLFARRQRARGDLELEIERSRSEEHTSELQSREKLVCRLLLEKHNTRSPARIR